MALGAPAERPTQRLIGRPGGVDGGLEEEVSSGRMKARGDLQTGTRYASRSWLVVAI